jgi:hypothetical protein
VNDSGDAEDRAIARALGAAPEAETAGADEQLVDQYREVLGAMQSETATPPLELEDRIVAAALARRPAATGVERPATVSSLDRARDRRRLRLRVAALAVATVAAAVVVGAIVQTGRTDSPVASGRLSLTTLKRADVDALLRTQGTRTGSFGAGLGSVAIGRDGNAAVYDLRIKAPLVVRLTSNGGTTSLAPTRPTGAAIAFVVDHPERVNTVSLVRNGVEIARAELSRN